MDFPFSEDVRTPKPILLFKLISYRYEKQLHLTFFKKDFFCIIDSIADLVLQSFT